MKSFRFLVVQVCSVFAILSASAAWTIDDSDTQHILISDGNWTFDVGKKGDYPSYDGALKSVKGFQLKAAVTIPAGSAAETLDFSTFKEDTRAKQGLDEPYGVTSSILTSAVLKECGITTFVGPDFVHLHTMLAYNPTLVSVTVSPDFCDTTSSMLDAPSSPVLTTFTPTVLPNWGSIGQAAFKGQHVLEGDFAFPNMTTVNNWPFQDARAITSLSFSSLVSIKGNFPFWGMSSLTNFYAPRCTFLGSSISLRDCVKLGDVTISPDVSSFGPSTFYGCTALTNLTPKTFPSLTSVGSAAFQNCKALRGVLSFPEATEVGGSAFAGSSIDEVYIPKAPINGENVFNGCSRLMKVTALGSGDDFPKNMFSLSTTGCVVHWLGDDVPTSYHNECKIQGSESSPIVFCLHTKAAQDAWVAQWATRTADQLTDADKAMSTYPGPKTTLAYCNPRYSIFFWLTKYIETVNVTIVCPDGVEVAGVTQAGFALRPNADGTYDADASDSMTITYRTTGDWIFVDGTTDHEVANVAVAASIPASTCDVETVIAAARIGETKYVSLQAAFDVGGDAVMIGDQSLAASVTVAADKVVRLDLGGGALTAVGITAFVNAGFLEILNGTVTADSLVSNTGTFRVKAGTYSEDVTSYCASGFHVVAQVTVPPTWKVVENVTHTLSLEQATLVAKHLEGVTLSCDGAFTCVTNEGVVVWSVPEVLPYVLTYVAEPGYRIGDSRTATVVNADGLTTDATVVAADVPDSRKVAIWVWDSAAKTLTDGNWTFENVVKSTEYGHTGLVINYPSAFAQSDTSVSNLDFSTCAETTGWPLVGIAGTFATKLPITKFVAPDVVRLNSTFGGNKTIEEVVVSPDLALIGSCFNGCTALRKITPTKLPNLAFAKQIFNNCVNLEGDFELDAWTVVDQDNPFTGCAKVTSLKLPNLTASNKNMEFSGMTSLTNFYAPKLTFLSSATLRDCSSLKTVVLSDAVSSIGNYAFYNCPALESFYPTTMTNLTNLGTLVFAYDELLPCDFDFPKVPQLAQSVFNRCGRLKSVKAPLAELKGAYAFYYCTNLVSLTVKGGTDLGGDYALGYVCPNLVVDWIGRDIPAAMKNWALCGVDNGRIQICVHDPDARQAWLDAYATRLRKNFTADDKANPTYPGKYAKGVHATGLNWYWITRPPSGLGLSVIVK